MSTSTIRLLAAIVFLLPSGCPPDKTAPRVEPGDEGPDVRLSSEERSFGHALASGDFDRDGLADIAISQEGLTWVCAGPLAGPSGQERCAGSLPGDHVSAGDLEGDGTLELMTVDHSEVFEPVVSIYAQPLSAPSVVAQARLLTSNLGPPLAVLADVHERPGVELVVGSAGYDGFGPDEGGKLVIFENSALSGETREDQALAVVDASFSADTFYGLELGDTSGDGLPDLLVSFTGFHHSNESYLLQAPLSLGGELEPGADVIFDWAHATFAGDLDGDGLPDVASPAYDSVRFWTGSLEGPDPGEPDARLALFEIPQNLTVRPAGDLDGDERQDVLIIDPVQFRTWLFFGPLEGDDEPDLLFSLPEDEILSFDQGLVVPDVDDNGTSELLLGSAHDLYGMTAGFVWLVGLPLFEGRQPTL
jgi:hypothetical protein